MIKQHHQMNHSVITTNVCQIKFVLCKRTINLSWTRVKKYTTKLIHSKYNLSRTEFIKFGILTHIDGYLD